MAESGMGARQSVGGTDVDSSLKWGESGDSATWPGSFALEEPTDDGQCLLWLLLHDPVAGILDHGGAHIVGGEADFGRQMCAIGVIAADRQHRHLQFALREELLIVDSVLRECGELPAQGVVDRGRAHRARRSGCAFARRCATGWLKARYRNGRAGFAHVPRPDARRRGHGS
jgi:hypothetical protein